MLIQLLPICNAQHVDHIVIFAISMDQEIVIPMVVSQETIMSHLLTSAHLVMATATLVHKVAVLELSAMLDNANKDTLWMHKNIVKLVVH